MKNEFLKTLKELVLFKPNIYVPWEIQFVLGLMFWMGVVITIYGLLKGIIN